MLLREKFPPTEGVQAGVSVGEMFRAALTTPFMLLMLFAMTMTASIEIGPTRWVPAVLEAGGIPGILVLVWINGLMAVLRHRAGTVVHRLSPPGVLLISAALTGVGLLAFSYASGAAAVFLTATVYAVGICYIWPTMLGVVSERVPKSGALGLGLMGAVGMATTGLVTAPQMGRVADVYAHDRLPVVEVVALLERADGELAAVPGPRRERRPRRGRGGGGRVPVGGRLALSRHRQRAPADHRLRGGRRTHRGCTGDPRTCGQLRGTHLLPISGAAVRHPDGDLRGVAGAGRGSRAVTGHGRIAEAV